MISLSFQKDSRIEDNIIRDISDLKKENDGIKDRIIRDIGTLFELKNEEKKLWQLLYWIQM